VTIVDKTEPIYLLQNQIASLGWGWNHDFLDTALTTRFLETNDLYVVEAYCGVLFWYGEKDDLPTLKKKLDSVRQNPDGKDRATKAIISAIQGAIEAIERGPVGSPSRIGPATLSAPHPTVEY